jgi:hypothetical protein
MSAGMRSPKRMFSMLGELRELSQKRKGKSERQRKKILNQE